LLWILRNWNRRRILKRTDTSEHGWRMAWSDLCLLRRLNDIERQRLRELAALFLHEKSLEPVQDLRLTHRMKQTIALQACLPVLNLGFDWIDDLVTVVVYPDTFVSEVTESDDAGVVHHYREARIGESWERGPLVLSWADVEAGHGEDGYNVVLHEVAHRLDALDGAVNGKPPLHAGMRDKAWRDSFRAAFEDFTRRVRANEATLIDPYAAASPAEFFAVFTEVFFETPLVVIAEYPAVYEQLAAFYRQDPGRHG
jgi:Mlc titration factor MtfA (ptsG expression regulator)